MKKKKPIPFDFVLEELSKVRPYTKPMFGCIAVYVGEKIVFILRDKKANSEENNGVWVATTPEHHASLREEFPSMRSLTLFGSGETGWQVLPSDSKDFEGSVFRACELVVKKDERIGKIPKSQRNKTPVKVKRKAQSKKLRPKLKQIKNKK